MSTCRTCKRSGKVWSDAKVHPPRREALCRILDIAVERKGDLIGTCCPTCEGEGTAPELLAAAVDLLAMGDKLLEHGDPFAAEEFISKAGRFIDVQQELDAAKLYLQGSPEENLAIKKRQDLIWELIRANQTLRARLLRRIKVGVEWIKRRLGARWSFMSTASPSAGASRRQSAAASPVASRCRSAAATAGRSPGDDGQHRLAKPFARALVRAAGDPFFVPGLHFAPDKAGAFFFSVPRSPRRSDRAATGGVG